MIGFIGSALTAQSTDTSAPKTTTIGSAADIRSGQPAADFSSSTQAISPLSRQLADSAVRAEERDNTLTRSELGSKAKNILNQISGDTYFANKAQHDKEQPDTDNLELLNRAKQATAYINEAAKGGGSTKNPFSGLSQEQLSHIIYDENGPYTVNERRAAWYEAYHQEETWRREVVHKAQEEYDRTGKLTVFFRSVLDHYNEFPAIEQAQYPENYASDLEQKIELNFNFTKHQAEINSDHPLGLIEVFFERLLYGVRVNDIYTSL